MAQSSVQQIVQQFLQYLSQRDLENITSLFADKIDWYIPGDEQKAPWLGKRTSKHEVKAFFDLLWSDTDPVDATIDHVFIDGNRAVIAGSFSTKMLKTGRIVDSLFFIHMVIDNDRIVWYRLLEDSLAVSRSLQ
jgi:uncharacterized protein